VDQTGGERVKEHILTGLRWITALGAEKGVGYGRLVEVTSEHFNREESRTDIISSPSDTIGLAITMVDPLMIGGVRIKDNYLKSEKKDQDCLQAYQRTQESDSGRYRFVCVIPNLKPILILQGRPGRGQVF